MPKLGGGAPFTTDTPKIFHLPSSQQLVGSNAPRQIRLEMKDLQIVRVFNQSWISAIHQDFLNSKSSLFRFRSVGMSYIIPWKGAFTNYLDEFLAFFDHLPPCVDIFYLINIDKNKTFLDYLPTSSCKSSLWTPPNDVYLLLGEKFVQVCVLSLSR